MKSILNLVTTPKIAATEELLKKTVAFEGDYRVEEITHIQILKRSIDARQRQVKINLRVEVYLNEPYFEKDFNPFKLHNISDKEEVVIVGMGPAGMFAALEAIELGYKPVIVERGKPVKERRRDLANITKKQVVNPDSNYCFGEGGAGTYSDGKLYTRSKKRGNTLKIFEGLVQFGATPEILVDAHPHIGTNKLPKVIENIREAILENGGIIHFDTKLTDLIVEDNSIKGVICGDQKIMANHVVLATGHSARDVFYLLDKKNIKIELKPFALGVRVEHQQNLIDSIQYSCETRSEFLPPSSYSLVSQQQGRGVYSFCMCPGGIIAPCATDQEEVVTNGWSPSKRDNEYSNSGIVVELKESDFDTDRFGQLAALEFQKEIEKKAWEVGGKTQQVPAQRMIDFVNGKVSSGLPKTSYHPGIVSKDLSQVFPKFITKALQGAFKDFGKKMKGYYTNEAVVHATESRTSSPVRIPRDKITLQHPEIKGLYPCGEGAGYAGGIASAGVDGVRCIQAIAKGE